MKEIKKILIPEEQKGYNYGGEYSVYSYVEPINILIGIVKALAENQGVDVEEVERLSDAGVVFKD